MTIENGMSQDQKVKLKSLLIKHEGDKDRPYLDTFGNITIGIGRNLSGTDLRPDEKELMYKNDVNFLYDYLSKNYLWFLELNEARQIAIIDMAFMGIKKFASFKKMISALSEHNYQLASIECLDSDYARKLINRAHDIARVLLSGVI